MIAARRSVRTFSDRPVEDAVIEQILEAALLAPSSCNHQLTTFIAIRDRDTIASAIGRPIADAGMLNRWLSKAPAVLAVCADPSKSASHHGVDFWQVDAAIAAEHVVLAAVDAGLGSCWVGGIDEPAIRSALSIPGEIRILALLALGYPAGRKSLQDRMVRAYAKGDTRKPMSELLRWGQW